jgi:glycosyltransferase involved in cell wall biosynthesis
MPPVNWVGTVHHGLPRDLFPKATSSGGGPLVFLGRISPEKRPDRAIEIARRAGLPLRIAAKVDAVDRAYFEAAIKPLLDHPLIEFVGEVDEAGKTQILRDARALLFPIDWPEPFGIVMIEAMACGTPIIAFDQGSVREVVEEGVTGFVVGDMDAAVEAALRAVYLDRAAIRRRFEARFTAPRMAADYLAIYERLVGAERQPLEAA